LSNCLAVDTPVDVAEPVLGPIAGSAWVARCEWVARSDTWEWEPAMFAVFGYRVGQVTPSWPAIVVLKHPDDVAASQAVWRAVQGGKGFSYTNRIFRADGCVRHLRASARVTSGPKGLPGTMHATIEVQADWERPSFGTEISAASDGALMLGLRARVPEALAEAFRRHASGVNGAARRFGGDAFTADDIVEDVFEGLSRSPERFDARRGTLGAYLNMQARSRCIDLARSESSRRQREFLAEHYQAAQPADEEALAAILRFDLRSGLAGLPDDERATIELAYFGGLSYRAVAERLGIPEGTAKSRIRGGLFRLRASMRRQLTEN
jgi:RNA polymerase sigma factor (sigma-70 family)